MKSAPGTILVVDDDFGLTSNLRDFLQQQGYTVEVALSGEEALATFDRNPHICLALVDLMMPVTDGLSVMDQLKRKDPDLAVVIMTGFATIETAVESMKRGAEDYLTKPLDPDAVERKVGRLMEVFALRGRVARLEANLQSCCPSFASLVYVSRPMQKVVDRARAIAEADSSVLILGETGTGKELLARAIHGASPRAGRAFIAVNCAALPRELVESELFGHRRGAFTGAITEGQGLFAAAHKGTLFLDEVGEMPKDVQAKLLRVLQDKEVRPVGGQNVVPVDVRVIAATNRSSSELRSEQLRSDFYFRIATVILEIPPLRTRPEDILVLAQHITERLTDKFDRQITTSRSALDFLLKYSFRGNVRELENVLESVCAVSHDDPQNITDKELRPLLDPAGFPDDFVKGTESTLALDGLEKVAIERALRISQGNRSKAASLLHISRDTLYRKMREFHITT